MVLKNLRIFFFFFFESSYISELRNVHRFRLWIKVLQWQVYLRGEVWVWKYVSQAWSQATVCQFSKNSYGDLDPADSRSARTFTAFAYIEIIKKWPFLSLKNSYGKDCINRNSRFNVVYSAQISRIAFHFWAIVFVTCMVLKQW